MEGRGYEPYEAVRCVTPNFLDGLWGQLASCPFLCLWKLIGVTQMEMLKVVKGFGYLKYF